MQCLYYKVQLVTACFSPANKCLTGKSVIMVFGVVLRGSLGAFWVVLIVVVEGKREKQATIDRIASMGCTVVCILHISDTWVHKTHPRRNTHT